MLKKTKYLLLLFIFYMCSNTFSQNALWTIYDTTNSPLPINDVRTIAIDKNDNKWFGTAYGGLVKYDGINWTIYNMSNSPIPSNYINAIAVDSLNHLWIATGNGMYNGLAYFDGINWKVYNSTSTPVAFGNTQAVAIDSLGNVWAYTMWCGLYELVKIDNKDSMTVYTSSNSGLPFSWVRDIEVDKNNTLWLSGYDKGLIKFDGINWTVYNPQNCAMPDSFARCIEIANNGDIWVGMYGGLAKFDGINWTVYGNTETNAIAETKNGDIWIGYDGQGVAKYDGSTWTYYASYYSGLSGDFVWDIKIDSSNVVWIGTFLKGISALNESYLGINDLTNYFSYSIFPNPLSTQTTLQTDNFLHNATITVDNCFGQTVKQIKNISGQTVTFSRDNLAGGLYFVHVTQDNQLIATKKLIITD